MKEEETAWQRAYRWLYKNGNPDEGDNPSMDYLENIQTRLGLEEKITIPLRNIGWMHYEIFSGRWRPYMLN